MNNELRSLQDQLRHLWPPTDKTEQEVISKVTSSLIHLNELKHNGGKVNQHQEVTFAMKVGMLLEKAKPLQPLDLFLKEVEQVLNTGIKL